MPISQLVLIMLLALLVHRKDILDLWYLLVLVVLTGALATVLANYIQKHLWIAYVGLGFILVVALQLVIGGLVDLEILSINENFKKYF